MKDETKITRQRMIELLNEDLAREYQAIIAYTIYSQTLKGAEYNHIAQELEKHAGEELSHALQIAKQIEAEHSEVARGKGVDLFAFSSLPTETRRGVAIFMALLMAFGALILFVACGNVASMLLARGIARHTF